MLSTSSVLQKLERKHPRGSGWQPRGRSTPRLTAARPTRLSSRLLLPSSCLLLGVRDDISSFLSYQAPSQQPQLTTCSLPELRANTHEFYNQVWQKKPGSNGRRGSGHSVGRRLRHLTSGSELCLGRHRWQLLPPYIPDVLLCFKNVFPYLCPKALLMYYSTLLSPGPCAQRTNKVRDADCTANGEQECLCQLIRFPSWTLAHHERQHSVILTLETKGNKW